MNRKIKVLFVVMDFWQAGAQRFAYEVHSALDSTRFNVDFLSYLDLNSSNHFDDYYYPKHIELGSKIFFFNNIIGKTPAWNRLLSRLFTNRISNKILPQHIKDRALKILNNDISKREKLEDYLRQFDVISWMGEYTFSFLSSFLEKKSIEKSVIHLMNAKFQGIHIYDNYPKDQHYIFTSGFDDSEQIEYEFSEIPNYKHVFFPLLLNITRRQNKWNFKKSGNKKIGIFTRLDPMKPLDPFMYAFHLLLDKLPNLELHIFGAGDPAKSGMERFTKHLGIENKVFFRGHVENLIQTSLDEELDLVWFQGYKNRPAGYAGFDICLAGIPQIFWEFTCSAEEINNDSPYPIFKNLNIFVAKSIDLLCNEDQAKRLSEIQFNDVIRNRDIMKNIGVLEDLYNEISTLN